MGKEINEFTETLLTRELLTDAQMKSIKQYDALGIFSLHNELRFLLYLGVLLFTSGIGTLVYKNIDSIGHVAVLCLLLLLIGIGFYFSFKKAKGFSKDEVLFDNPVYDYIVLLCTILSCVFIGYLQYQYQVFGYGLSSLVCSLVGFFCAYYFDNKSALSIGITGLATFIGISITPKALLENEIYNNPSLIYYGIALGGFLLLWAEYSERISLKKHFHLLFLTFALHLIGICSIAALFETYWYIFVFLLAATLYYFYKISYVIGSIFLFVFTVLYGYIGFNIILFKLIDFIDFSDFWQLLTILTPVYFIGSIFGFIRLIKHFNNEKS
ncbi:DUF2157 domain-containing protein [Flavobacterium paronense]|uniref:DUF2157 domain-containing protein n=1 Tax=Flavobacterium paronense TaxID=1392775 RepID=A0ABV5GFX3_9FLAO|nr:DUF2157 domain-containing protein [Flavobacterium paronense]MDN3678489.1 DUF2157 domain-containing protein [Flavobacterium paronense]